MAMRFKASKRFISILPASGVPPPHKAAGCKLPRMKKQLYPLLALAMFAISLCSCGSSSDHLWFYSFGSGASQDSADGLTPASFLELRPDGSYTNRCTAQGRGRLGRSCGHCGQAERLPPPYTR